MGALVYLGLAGFIIFSLVKTFKQAHGFFHQLKPSNMLVIRNSAWIFDQFKAFKQEHHQELSMHGLQTTEPMLSSPSLEP
jgi:hypothetical protein